MATTTQEKLAEAILDNFAGIYFGQGRDDVAERYAGYVTDARDTAFPIETIYNRMIADDMAPSKAETFSRDLMALCRGIR